MSNIILLFPRRCAPIIALSSRFATPNPTKERRGQRRQRHNRQSKSSLGSAAFVATAEKELFIINFKLLIFRMTNEIWHKCEVPYTRYEVSNQGRVRNAHTGLVLRPRKVSHGYRKVTLFYKGQQKHCYVHNLVATAFVEGWREGLEVNHKNGVKTDNRAENLEWVTRSENHQHAHDVLLLDVKPVALLDERGHLQYVFNSARACSRMMGGNVQEHIRKKHRYHGYRPRYISVPMYREIVHLVNVHHYTLHSAWIEANISLSDSSNGSNCSMQQSCGSNGNHNY